MQQDVYRIQTLGRDFYAIHEKTVRAFLLVGSERALLVDSGFGGGDLRGVVESLTDLPVVLVNTHADPDHIGANGQLGSPLMHPAEFDRYGAAGPAPTALWEGDTVDIGGRVLEAVLLSGHTPGSIALLDRAERALFSGDSVLTGPLFLFGPGRSLPAYIAALERLQGMRGLFGTIYPAHGELPVGPGLIDGLLEGARAILARRLPGERVTVHGKEVVGYAVGATTILLDD